MGLSGGLDSAVSAVLCKEALGRERVLCLILPCESQKQDLRDAALVARRFNLKAKTVDITPIYRPCLKALPPGGRVARANLKVRLRMSVLYYFANTLHYLVCGTSNRSELMCGYFTKYGDGASDILPLGGIFKTQVRRLAALLGIPRRIIAKPPTAGLWPGQTDEKDLGISYSQLDDILLRLQGKRKQIQHLAQVEKVRSYLQASEHKRRLPPICSI